MAPSNFSLRVQHGIATGFAPAQPTAVYTFSRSAAASPIALTAATRVPPARNLSEPASKSIASDEVAEALLDEIYGILKGLPNGRNDLADISLDVGMEWKGGLSWRNLPPPSGGRGGPGGAGLVGDEERKKFRRAVEAADELVAKAQ